MQYLVNILLILVIFFVQSCKTENETNIIQKFHDDNEFNNIANCDTIYLKHRESKIEVHNKDFEMLGIIYNNLNNINLAYINYNFSHYRLIIFDEKINPVIYCDFVPSEDDFTSKTLSRTRSINILENNQFIEVLDSSFFIERYLYDENIINVAKEIEKKYRIESKDTLLNDNWKRWRRPFIKGVNHKVEIIELDKLR